MNCGRHCTFQDYNDLIENTEQYLKCLDSGDSEALTTKLNIYLEFIADFDYLVAERLRLKIQSLGSDYSQTKRLIKREIDELIHNVLVDVREHN